MKTPRLKGYRALVTGASSGIGEAIACELASHGADLVIAARRRDRLNQLGAKLGEAHGVKVEAIETDLSRPDAVARLHEAATAGGREVNILVNNAGVGPYGKFLQAPWNKHLDTLQINSTSLTELCHRFGNSMLELPKDRPCYILNIASIAAFQGTPNFAAYSGTKSYVRVFSEILNRELAGSHVSVTCVCPGGTYTEFLEVSGQVLKESGHGVMMTAEEVARIGLQAMLDRKPVMVPGWLNKLACFMPRLIPRGLALTFAEKAMRRAVDERHEN